MEPAVAFGILAAIGVILFLVGKALKGAFKIIVFVIAGVLLAMGAYGVFTNLLP